MKKTFSHLFGKGWFYTSVGLVIKYFLSIFPKVFMAVFSLFIGGPFPLNSLGFSHQFAVLPYQLVETSG